MMSSTILDKEAFCREIGIDHKTTKFIDVNSTFPVENRIIRHLGLNVNTLKQEDVRQALVKAVDRLMNQHNSQKGIIHTTSYEQLRLVKENLSETNRRRLLETNPELERDEVIERHIANKSPRFPTRGCTQAAHSRITYLCLLSSQALHDRIRINA